MEKVEGGGPTWLAKSGLADLGGWGPRKYRELKGFFSEVKATTVVVIMTTLFFGFYLYGLDLIMSQIFTRVLSALQ